MASQQHPTAAALAHTNVILICSAGRTPTATAETTRPGETALRLQVSGAGYGATISLIGPAEILATVVAAMDNAMQQADR